MNDERIAAGSERAGENVWCASLDRRERGSGDASPAATLRGFLASKKSDGLTGKLISAVWDDWQALPERIEALRTSDVFTLRRILPKDRGLAWADK